MNEGITKIKQNFNRFNEMKLCSDQSRLKRSIDDGE